MIIIAISFWTIFSRGESTPICQGLCGGGAAGGRGSTSSGSNHTSPRMHSSRGTGVPSSCSLATEANCEPALSSNPPVSWWCSEKIAQIDPRSSQPSKPVGFRHVSPPGRDLSLSLWWAGIGARAGILRVAAAQLKFMACGAMGRFRRNPNGATQPWWVCHVSDNLGNFFLKILPFCEDLDSKNSRNTAKMRWNRSILAGYLFILLVLFAHLSSCDWPVHSRCKSFIVEIESLHRCIQIYIYIYIIYMYTGWWFETVFIFPSYWECHHPNWLTPSFFRGVGQPPTSIDIYIVDQSPSIIPYGVSVSSDMENRPSVRWYQGTTVIICY